MNVALRVLVALWSVWNLVPPIVAALMCMTAYDQWSPSSTGRAPAFQSEQSLYLQFALAIGVSIVLGGCALVFVLLAVDGLRGKPAPRRWAVVLSCAALVSGLAPALTRGALPDEDPYTGEGSPLAVIIGVLVLGTAGAILFTLPGIVLMMLATHRAGHERP